MVKRYSSNHNPHESDLRVLEIVEATGFGGTLFSSDLSDDLNSTFISQPTRVIGALGNAKNSPSEGEYYGLQVVTVSRYGFQLLVRASSTNKVAIRRFVSGRYIDSMELLHSLNTTVDANGFIKEASPIIKLHADHLTKNGDFGGELHKNGVGDYRITGTTGLAQKGWYIETPRDANGNLKVFVEFEDNDGDLHIRTSQPRYQDGRAVAGEPMDIPAGRWIDIRLNEPPESDDGHDMARELTTTTPATD